MLTNMHCPNSIKKTRKSPDKNLCEPRLEVFRLILNRMETIYWAFTEIRWLSILVEIKAWISISISTLEIISLSFMTLKLKKDGTNHIFRWSSSEQLESNVTHTFLWCVRKSNNSCFLGHKLETVFFIDLVEESFDLTRI